LIKKGIQKGGLLHFILPFALSFLGGLLKDWVSSKIVPQNQNEPIKKWMVVPYEVKKIPSDKEVIEKTLNNLKYK
jgi:hypothetical protein